MEVRRVLPRDAIESIDDPTFSNGYDGDPDDRLLVVATGDGPARAYPVLVLNYHEIVNDVVEGEPVAVTWCPLCGSAVVYDRVVDGQELRFGVSGKLAEDDLVMYDRETESEWKQSTGACIAGPLRGDQLTVRPASMTTLGRFREAYPDGVVLDPPEGERRVVSADGPGEGLRVETREIDYSVDHYAEYVSGSWLGSRSRDDSREWNRTDVAAKEIVLGLALGGEAIGVPRSSVPDAGVLRLGVGNTDVVVLEVDETLHGFEDPGFEFEPAGDGRFRADGTTWDGDTGRSDDGRSLTPVPSRRLFAFAWQADHGDDSFNLPE
ncbi:MAG TPA: DUF3179 domain-containing protein [Halobacteriales archaeon]|nr:DUF3179 domain-containing protein [Halobacteriales archaeon]